MANLRVKDIKRKPFTEKQLEMLEKCHYLLTQSKNCIYSLDGWTSSYTPKHYELHRQLYEKVEKLLW